MDQEDSEAPHDEQKVDGKGENTNAADSPEEAQNQSITSAAGEEKKVDSKPSVADTLGNAVQDKSAPQGDTQKERSQSVTDGAEQESRSSAESIQSNRLEVTQPSEGNDPLVGQVVEKLLHDIEEQAAGAVNSPALSGPVDNTKEEEAMVSGKQGIKEATMDGEGQGDGKEQDSAVDEGVSQTDIGEEVAEINEENSEAVAPGNSVKSTDKLQKTATTQEERGSQPRIIPQAESESIEAKATVQQLPESEPAEISTGDILEESVVGESTDGVEPPVDATEIQSEQGGDTPIPVQETDRIASTPSRRKKKWTQQHYTSPRKRKQEAEKIETNNMHKWEQDQKNNAAIIIQGAYRTFAERQDSDARDKYATEIQRIYRGHASRKGNNAPQAMPKYFEESVDQTIAAVEIQRAARGRLARGKVDRFRQEEFAAKEVQRLVRGRQARRNFQKERQNVAAVRAQKRIRIYQAKQRRIELQRAREKELEIAARKIQKEMRRCLNAGGFQNADTTESTAATTIQAQYRGSKARRELLRQQQAATHVQAHVRGYQERQLQHARHESATKAQACFRGHNQRCARAEACRAASSIQSQYRGCKARKEFIEMRSAATKAQAHLRGYQARKRLNENRQRQQAATEIQRTLRGRQCRHWIEARNESAIEMQRIFRGHQCRCAYQAHLSNCEHSDDIATCQETNAKAQTFVTCPELHNCLSVNGNPTPSTQLALARKAQGVEIGVQTERITEDEDDVRVEQRCEQSRKQVIIGIDEDGQVSIIPELIYVSLVVGMKKFSVLRNVLMRYPNSLIGRVLTGRDSVQGSHKGYLEFPRNGSYFTYILDFYYTRQLPLRVRQDEVLRAAVEAEALYFELHTEMFQPEVTKPAVIQKNFERWLRLNGSPVQFQVRPHERLKVVSIQGNGVLLMNLIANDAEVIPEATVFDTASRINQDAADKVYLDMPPYPGGDDFMYSFIVASCVQASHAEGAAWLKVEFSIHIKV